MGPADAGDRDSLFPRGAALGLGDLGGSGVHALLASLRTSEPVSWLPALGGWLVTSREIALDVMRDPGTFTVDDPRFSTAQVVGPSMLSLDGADHERHRTPFADPFRSSAVRDAFADWTRDEARRLVSELAPSGYVDLASSLAAPLAVSTITKALGLVDVDEETMLAWYTSIVDAVVGVAAGREVPEAGTAAVAALRRQVETTVAEATGSLLSTVAGVGTLDRTEVFSNTAILLFGAIETSQGMTSNALLHLLSHPDQLAEVRAALADGEEALLDNAVEESLRFEPAVALVDRYATTDVDLGGAAIRRGELVSISLTAVNRDPAAFADPDRFDVHRPNARQNLSFVHGPHACLGMHLARLETREALWAVADLLAGVRLDPDGTEPPRGLIFRRAPTVVAAWDPAG
ncbi:MAG: cytochrome P450 [Acidimicrobiaceae bacterium]|nr:cytochrome P450 [Acidimicrobiaceae bacterium]